mmetsp:Transcript_20420/g.28407  ORF Transcript_20420/g.28407 Transcript_20420/m.28407 type:complete len:223 (-) Transcript_20420:169-837(-)
MLACFGLGNPKAFEEPATISPEETIRNLRNHIDRQEKREKFIDLKLINLAKEAKAKLAEGDKRGAVGAMKKRKLYQAEQQKIANIKMTLETQAIGLESAATSADAFSAMATGTNTMKKIRNDMGGVERVDDIMEGMQEEMDMQGEVNAAIGQSVDPLMGMLDEDDLMKELDDMAQGDLQDQFDQVETGKKYKTKLNMPQVPTSGLSKKEEAELQMLQAELAA